MPAYNAERYINCAVDSLINGTYPCDIFIVDDGSRVPVTEVLKPVPRTHVIRLEQNAGVVSARNAGLRAILARQYEFVACLDADDVCRPERIALQVEFLDSHPDVAVVGSWGRHVAEWTGETIGVNRTPAGPAEITKALRFNMAIINTSAMIRVSALREVGLYSNRYPAAEDYELVMRMAARFPLANIPKVLVDICISPQGVSLKRRHRQLYDRLRIQLAYFEPLQAGAWLGLVKTLTLFFTPTILLRKIKYRTRVLRAEVAHSIMLISQLPWGILA
jgi:glycosyltransferase involved in cell wall biosynthesis